MNEEYIKELFLRNQFRITLAEEDGTNGTVKYAIHVIDETIFKRILDQAMTAQREACYNDICEHLDNSGSYEGWIKQEKERYKFILNAEVKP
jgi:hypothetical protein